MPSLWHFLLILRRIVDRNTQRDDAGASMVEYALLLALIVVVAIAAVVVIGHVTNNSINNTANAFPQ